MSSGIIGAWSGVGSMTYTPNTLTKVALHFAPLQSSYYVRINGITMNNTGAAIDIIFWIGAGQTVVIDTVVGGNVIISALEG